ncbi:hypothetical protein DH2020_040978 [Rehmannia glutinosa]|uniref:Putative plant transposon protein domain-containing protein n=1 Tax=Rehmannia glutinosa TaxID=99300 RepID=A0ABR0USG9_REHGL
MAAKFAEARAIPTDSGIDPSKSYSRDFISVDASKNWKSYKQRVFQDKKIHMQEFESNNMIGYLKERQLFGSVTYVRPYVERVVKEFYCNLLLDSFNPNSAKFGEVFLRKKVYHFTSQIVNEFLGTEDVIEDGQEIAIANWLPTANNAAVTKEQAYFLYRIGMKHKINFGSRICAIISSYVERVLEIGLPFPSLIYSILESQGFAKKETEKLIHIKSLIRIKPHLHKGERHVDLPLRCDKDITAPSSPSQIADPVLAYLIKQEKYATSQIEYWIKQRDELKRLISGQKGGVSGSKSVADDEGSSDEEDGGNDAENVGNI